MTTRIDQFSSPAAAGGGSGTGEVNAWIVGDDEEVIVIDPGTDTAGLLDAVGDREGRAEAHPGEEADIEMEDGGVFEVADVQLEVIHAPGHTAGSVCLYCEDLGAVFTGHALLAEGPAPQDGEFPDFAGQLTAIGEYLLTLPEDTRVLPGHGPETTIATAEKKFDGWVSGGPAAVSPSSLGD